MRETMSVFLKDLGVPDGTVGFEMLGEALEKSMGFIQQRRRINLTALCAALGDKYGRISYYISPKLLYEETGYVWNGEKK